MTTYKAQVLEILKTTGKSMTHVEIFNAIPRSYEETISRALRRLYALGCVTKRPEDPAKPHGRKLWTAIPNATIPVRSTTPTPVQPVGPTSSKGSSGKAFAMCLPANKPTLVTATIQVIAELVDAKEKFSAHDITAKLRDMVKDGKIHVDGVETGTVHAYGKQVPRITHEDVKGIVHEYFHVGKMGNYERVMDGDHWVYQEPVTIVATPPAPPIVLVVPADDYDGEPAL